MMIKTARWSRLVSASLHGSWRPLAEAAVDVAKRLCRIRVPRRVWLVALGLAVGITLAAGGSARADAQSRRSPNANVVDEFLAELGANPGAIAPSSVPKCSSPNSSTSPNPLRILDNQTYALCALASCVVFNEVAYCKCDVKTGDSISLTLNFDDENVCTVNEEGAATGSYMVSTFSIPLSVLKPHGDVASYNCPGATPGRAGSDGAYAQCDGGICFTSTQGQPSPFSDEPLAKDEIICSCPITEHNPKSPVGYEISGPYPCQQSYFENCSKAVANSKTGSMLQVGSPPGAGEVLGSILTKKPPPPSNMCFLRH